MSAKLPARDLERCEHRIRRLQAVVDASRMVNSTLDLKQLGERVIAIATDLIGAERGSLFLVDRPAGVLHSLVAQGLPELALTLQIGEGIVGAVAESGQATIINDPYSDPRFDRNVDRVTGFRTRSLLTVPVRDRDSSLVAVLQLLNRRQGAFSSEDVDFLAELGSPFAIGLTTARLHREIVERERMQEELRLAAEIQRTLQPRDWGQIPGLALESLSRPCREVGGDYHDLIPTDRHGRFWLTVADISGKGVSAGLIASNVQSYLWSRRSDGRPLPRVVAEGSELLYRLTRGRKFATAILAEWDPADRTLSWVNAGHVPLLLRRGNTVTAIEATGRPMGLLPGEHYRSTRRQLHPGDLFLMCTDGVLEAGMASTQGELGLERLDACLRRASSAAAAVVEVENELQRHLGEDVPDDDVTVLCGQCL